MTAAKALGRYGVRANAICPRARTAMTADVFGAAPELGSGEVDPLSPEHVVSLVRFLASPAADGVNGQVFVVYGPTVTLVAAPTAEHRFHAEGPAWDPAALGTAMRDYFTGRDPVQTEIPRSTVDDIQRIANDSWTSATTCPSNQRSPWQRSRSWPRHSSNGAITHRTIE